LNTVLISEKLLCNYTAISNELLLVREKPACITLQWILCMKQRISIFWVRRSCPVGQTIMAAAAFQAAFRYAA
jgi:hypothetical protein